MYSTKTFAFAALCIALVTAPLFSMNPAEKSRINRREAHTKVARRKLGKNYGSFGGIKKMQLNPATMPSIMPLVKEFKATLVREQGLFLDNLILRKVNAASKRVKEYSVGYERVVGYHAQEAFIQHAWDLYNNGQPLVKYVSQQKNQTLHENKEQS